MSVAAEAGPAINDANMSTLSTRRFPNFWGANEAIKRRNRLQYRDLCVGHAILTAPNRRNWPGEAIFRRRAAKG
jgi:hypothetical protein